MLSWKPWQKSPCGRTPGKSHHTTCPTHPSLVIKTMKMRARQRRNPPSRAGRSFRSGRRPSHLCSMPPMELRSRKSCSKATSQDELTPLEEDNTFTWHASTISSTMIRNQTALTHVPKGRDAWLILAFARDNQYNIRITEERTALSEYTIDPCSIIAACDTRWTAPAEQPLDHEESRP